jgi:hypothetical protein
MKKAIAVGLAAIVAAGAFAIAPTEASAGSGYWMSDPGPFWGGTPYPYHHRHRQSGAYFSFGGPDFRFSFGVPVYPMYRHHSYSYAYANPHVAWCSAHFRTYNPGNNMYFAKKGVMVACNSPYAY